MRFDDWPVARSEAIGKERLLLPAQRVLGGHFGEAEDELERAFDHYHAQRAVHVSPFMSPPTPFASPVATLGLGATRLCVNTRRTSPRLRVACPRARSAPPWDVIP